MQDAVSFHAKWDVNPLTTPALVNQMLVTEGTGTSYGPDGILYLVLGHVIPPTGEVETENGEAVLRVNTVGNFALTVERAKELRDLLSHIIGNMEHRKEAMG